MEERAEPSPAPQGQSQQEEYVQEQYENPVVVMVDISKKFIMASKRSFEP